ncbi:MAG TPA: co-chaperone GroES [Clostridiales bacterium]|nr:co-chaperone GroES [Clostridiales bacterium]
MKIKPLFDKILLIEEQVDKAKTGIVLPDIAKDKPNIAKVVAVGNGGIIDGNNVEIKVNVGEKVLFNKYATSEFKIDNTTYLLIKQADILAILEE